MAAALAPVSSARPLRRQLAGKFAEPLKQGELDCLCGLYAIVNALRLLLAAHPLKRREEKRIFNRGVTWLCLRSQLALALLVGSGDAVWREMLADLLDEAGEITGRTLRMTQPLRDVGAPQPAHVFELIEAAICQRQPVLVEVAGYLQHYTVISGYTANRLNLFDSGELNTLWRQHCLKERTTDLQTHIIDPRSLTILSVD
jgi:hypothetical protein